MMLDVMEIERFAVHDGPGIRSVVFIKGCPLHCPWCANPESQSTESVLLHKKDRCIGCRACQKVCERGAIKFTNGEKPIFNCSLCTNCRKCADVCLQDAIAFSGTKMDTQEILNIVLRDKDYYIDSGGGVTLSGGEPMLQGEVLLELLLLFQINRLHVAVETSGHFPHGILDKAMPLIDLFLFDVKHVDSDKLFRVTGGDLALIFANLKKILKSGKEVIVRIPVIPGFNHSQEDMLLILSRVAELGIKQVNLLPYHTLGRKKYDEMGIEYIIAGKMLQKEDLNPYLPIGYQLGLNVTIGG